MCYNILVLTGNIIANDCVNNLFSYWNNIHFGGSMILFHWSYDKQDRTRHGHFIWNLWNSPKARFIKSIWNDHLCKVLFITVKQGPVVQSIISLMSSLRGQLVKDFMTL